MAAAPFFFCRPEASELATRTGVAKIHDRSGVVENAPTAGDYFEVRSFQNSGGNLDVHSSSWFSAMAAIVEWLRQR